MRTLLTLTIAAVVAGTQPSGAGIFDWLLTDPAQTPVSQPQMTLPEAETRGSPGSTRSSDPRCKLVGSDWSWVSDHVAATVTYVIEADPTRTYQVGTGLSFLGKPRGAIRSQMGRSEITAYGVGALHVRISDGGPPMTVCAAQGSLSTITFFDVDF